MYQELMCKSHILCQKIYIPAEVMSTETNSDREYVMGVATVQEQVLGMTSYRENKRL